VIPVLHPSLTRALPDIHAFNHAEALMRVGRYREGWSELVATHSTFGWMRDFIAEWEGPHQDLTGKRILVAGEGGYGDNFYFWRWLHPLRRWGADVHYLCQPSLAPLVRHQKYRAIENWAGNVDIDWSEYAYFSSVFALPGKLGVTLGNYSWDGAYISVGSGLRMRTHRHDVGFCWKAGETTSEFKPRTLSRTQADRLVAALPKGECGLNLNYDIAHPGLIAPPLRNWLDTAFVLRGLKLMVTVDTGVAHLAGAMGVRTIVMLPKEPAWHYPDGAAEHPLYPSMRIVRSADDEMATAVDQAIEMLEVM
jgi:Glycosyltransferase family 9 (heptosyltransferase)